MKSVTHSLCFHRNKFRTRYLAGRGLKVSTNITQKTNWSDSWVADTGRVDVETLRYIKQRSFFFYWAGRLLRHLLTLLWVLAWKEKRAWQLEEAKASTFSTKGWCVQSRGYGWVRPFDLPHPAGRRNIHEEQAGTSSHQTLNKQAWLYWSFTITARSVRAERPRLVQPVIPSVLGLFSPVVSKRTDNSYFEAFLLHVCTPLVCPIWKCMPVNVCTCMCVCSAALPTALVILVPVLRGSLLVGQLRSRSPLPWCDRRAVTSTRRPLAESAGSSSHARAWVSSQLRVHTIWYAHTNELTAQCICAGAHTYIRTHWGLHPGVDWQ